MRTAACLQIPREEKRYYLSELTTHAPFLISVRTQKVKGQKRQKVTTGKYQQKGKKQMCYIKQPLTEGQYSAHNPATLHARNRHEVLLCTPSAAKKIIQYYHHQKQIKIQYLPIPAIDNGNCQITNVNIL